MVLQNYLIAASDFCTLVLSSAVAKAIWGGYLKFAEPLAVYLLNVSALQRKQ